MATTTPWTNQIVNSPFHPVTNSFPTGIVMQGKERPAYRKRPKHMQMMMNADMAKLCVLDGINFYHADTDSLVSTFGGLKPAYGGRPQKWAMLLLQSVPSPCRSDPATQSFAYLAVTRGLLYTLPFIPGRRKTSFRLTTAGIGLLDHWSEKHKKFAAFRDAFVTKQAREEIASDCVDMAMGVMPTHIACDIAVQKLKIEAIQKKKNDELARQQQAQFLQAYLAQQQAEEAYRRREWIAAGSLGQAPSLFGASLLGGQNVPPPPAVTSSALSNLLSRANPWKR